MGRGFFIRGFFLLSMLALCACGGLTLQDHMELRQIREYWKAEKGEEDSILYQLVQQDPDTLAAQAATRGDYRLISMAAGYEAGEEDAEIMGVKCSAPVETQPLVFGCVPPPTVMFKLMLYYNLALIEQPDFPHRDACKVDEKVAQAIQKMKEGE